MQYNKTQEEAYWSLRYADGATGWDIKIASTPLISFMDSVADKSTKILIPGAGYGHEAIYLVENGFTDVTVCDLAIQPLQRIKFINNKINIIHGDFFELTDKYDIILEQTFFCAIPRINRMDYVVKMNQLLSDNGLLVGVLFNKELPLSGPPHGGSRKEYEKLFEPFFEIVKLEECYNSISPRSGNEFFIKFVKQN